MPELILTLKGRELKRIGITKPELTIGRDPDDDLSIDNIGISRGHVKIRVTSQGDIFALDNQSRNGTFVNGSRIAGRHKLTEGDEIQLAKYRIQYSTGGPPLDLNRLRQSARDEKSTSKMGKSSQGTLSFSNDEIKSIIKAGDVKAPRPQPKTAPPTPTQPAKPAKKAAQNNQLVIVMGMTIVILLLVIVVIVLLKKM